MNLQEAEIVAIRAASWLSGADERLLNKFFATTGATAEDFGRIVEDNDFRSTVLDFILAEDRSVIEFCEQARLPLDAPLLARQAMPGGDLPHWT